MAIPLTASPMLAAVSMSMLSDGPRPLHVDYPSTTDKAHGVIQSLRPFVVAANPCTGDEPPWAPVRCLRTLEATAGLTLREDQRLTFVMVLLNNTGKEIVNKMEIDVTSMNDGTQALPRGHDGEGGIFPVVKVPR